MSAEVELLRRAAALMREQFPDRCDCAGGLIETTAHEVSCSIYASDWPRAVADLLDIAATHQVGFTPVARKRITAVAHAYLGESDA